MVVKKTLKHHSCNKDYAWNPNIYACECYKDREID